MTQMRAGLDPATERLHAYLDTLAPDTHSDVVAMLVRIAFVDDPDVVGMALEMLAGREWASTHTAGLPRRNRMAYRVTDDDGQTGWQRELWYDFRPANAGGLEQMDAVIAERERVADGVGLTLADLRRVRDAMAAFPDARPAEAARLAGVQLRVLQMPTGTEG